ncbi:hypothetical protein SBRY_110213 [Actinacidiphila bryophytorum]|uniref:Uncharacterized protein n=1 Tax=Actinacidiphila bryophytorum TaxID=1436133 RepID=A0A9W4GXA2_9ACTN|nr:hypothetical protein SBRY_110213 [Actinacidiphila bryophytorum]
MRGPSRVPPSFFRGIPRTHVPPSGRAPATCGCAAPQGDCHLRWAVVFRCVVMGRAVPRAPEKTLTLLRRGRRLKAPALRTEGNNQGRGELRAQPEWAGRRQRHSKWQSPGGSGNCETSHDGGEGARATARGRSGGVSRVRTPSCT